jgi:hypothetical protein
VIDEYVNSIKGCLIPVNKKSYFVGFFNFLEDLVILQHLGSSGFAQRSRPPPSYCGTSRWPLRNFLAGSRAISVYDWAGTKGVFRQYLLTGIAMI